MTDFVITEDELIGAEFGELDRCECEHIRSRPLSEELKKERERVLNKLESWRIQVNNRDGKRRVELGLMIESLRGEP